MPIETIELFDESTILKLSMPAKQDDLPHSMMEMMEYFKEELLKKDKKIMELQCALNAYKFIRS